MSTTEPIRDKDQLKLLADYFLSKGQTRNYVLVVLGTCTALRISDLLPLRWDDLLHTNGKEFRSRITITEQKTKKKKTIALNPQAIEALRRYYPERRGAYIFASRNGNSPIDRSQAWRILHNAAVALGLEGNISCHSLRKTWGYHAWTSGEISPVVITEVYNHSSYQITKRYLGVEQDDLDRAYLKLNLF